MNWKSTAVVSGASVLAAWLGISSEAPLPRCAARVPSTADDSRERAAVPDVQRQIPNIALSLLTRDYAEPTRNPFKFGERRVPTRARAVVAPAPAGGAPVAALPAPPPFTLAGIGGTDNAGAMQYTAVLSTPGGVVLAKQGDAVSGWTVDAVDEGGLMVRAADGRVERLSLPQ